MGPAILKIFFFPRAKMKKEFLLVCEYWRVFTIAFRISEEIRTFLI